VAAVADNVGNVQIDWSGSANNRGVEGVLFGNEKSGAVARVLRLLHEPTLKATKIDPPMAAFNAIALMSTNPWWSRPSIFVIDWPLRLDQGS